MIGGGRESPARPETAFLRPRKEYCHQGKYTFAHALDEYRHTVQTAVDLKDSSKCYREQTIAALLKSWPGLMDLPITKITEKACKDWAAKLSEAYSPTRYNNTLGTLRAVIQVAVGHGYCSRNPAMSAKKARITNKRLILPSREQFRRFIKEMRTSVGRLAKPAADLTEFLAYSGCRKEEAARATWKDVNFETKELTIVGDPVTGTKNWQYRTIPMVSNLIDLLKRLKEKRGEEPDPNDPICLVRESQKTMDRAAKAVNISRLTHHNLRDLFATQCIESGVDIPTVAKWLGHSDGGTLCMEKYVNPRVGPGHESAAKVQF